MARAAGDLRRAEVPAEGPQRPALVSADGARDVRGLAGFAVFGWLAGGPAARDAPGVEPVHDRGNASHHAVGERVARVAEDADLHAHPALGIDVRGRSAPDVTGGDVPRGRPGWREVLGGPQCPARPQDGDELRDLARGGVPDEVARAL